MREVQYSIAVSANDNNNRQVTRNKEWLPMFKKL